MTALSHQITYQLLIKGRQSADTIGRALDFSTPVIERQLERMVESGMVGASVDTADGPVMFAITEEERHRCRWRRNDRQQVEIVQ